MIIYMNLKIIKMSKLKYTKEYITDGEKFHWDSDTIDYYADYQDANGWASTAFKIYKYVADECEWSDEADMRALYLDLLTQVENNIFGIFYFNEEL